MTTEQNCWAQIDAMKKSGDELLAKLRRRRGWSMKEPKPDGTMIAERSEGFSFQGGQQVKVRDFAQVMGKTHAEIARKVATAEGVCWRCFHSLKMCGPNGCSVAMPLLPTMKEHAKGESPERPRCGCTEHKAQEAAP
jgi:hypothetical protein